MSRNQINKEEIRTYILQLKSEICGDYSNWNNDPAGLTHKYLNMILNKIEEYRY